MMQIQFSDKMVTYETFVNDIAARLFAMMAEKDDKAFISQRRAAMSLTKVSYVTILSLN
jgi:hypothetical protein